jgi:hypothetical protein
MPTKLFLASRRKAKGNNMTRFTDRTIRASGQWIKITRDNKNRTFTFARGYAGQFQASEIETLPFKWVANWTEAQDKANRTIATYA